MQLRSILIAAAVVAPLAGAPAPVSAQARGLDRAVSATEQAEAVAGWTYKKAPKQAKGAPAGVARVFDDTGNLPPGIGRTREQDTSAPPESPPESDPETCSTTLVFLNGQWWVQDCHGNLFPV
ncbi:MAG TPA: hypothetical protein VLA09_12380 [Longimicrobiales bacterium]|nr:hypothetical protein [Longimicrobiales bacterium]